MEDLVGEAPATQYKNVLALDLGHRMGYAFRCSNGSLMSGTWEFSRRKYDSHGVAFRLFRERLDQFHAISPIDFIVYEAVRMHKGVDAAHIYGGFWAVLLGWCDEKLIDFSGLPVGTIKKHITGNGAANKELMCRCISQMGFPHLTPPDDMSSRQALNKLAAINNEADALGVLFTYEQHGLKGA